MKFTRGSARPAFALCCALLGSSFLAAPCRAAPYELTVYSDDIPEVDEAEAEFIFSRARPRQDDDVPPGKIVQGLAEYSVGIAPGWALGVELPVAHAAGQTKLKGLKGEVQYVAPHDARSGWYWGVRCDLGYESSVYEKSGGNSVDVNPILGFRWSSWHVVLNPSFEMPLSGVVGKRATFLPSGRLAREIDETNTLALEYFADVGPLTSFLPHRRKDETAYLVWDKKMGTRKLSLGVGQPISAPGNVDKWVLRAAISFELD